MKVRCIEADLGSSLIEGNLYTIQSEYTNNDGVDFYVVQEVENGHNQYFTWRFKSVVEKLNNNVKIL